MTAYLDWAAFGVLPRGGGTFDQDAELMVELRLVARIFDEAAKARRDEEAGR